jgi:hypothetical protein
LLTSGLYEASRWWAACMKRVAGGCLLARCLLMRERTCHLSAFLDARARATAAVPVTEADVRAEIDGWCAKRTLDAKLPVAVGGKQVWWRFVFAALGVELEESKEGCCSPMATPAENRAAVWSICDELGARSASAPPVTPR